MRLQLTENAIKREHAKLAPGARAELADTHLPGLRLRLKAGDVQRAAWVLGMRDPSGKAIRVPLGRYPDMGIKEARELARKQRVAVKAGADPIGQARAKRAAARDALAGIGTLDALVSAYERQRGSKLRSWAEQRRRVASVFAKAMDKPVTSLTRLGLQAIADAHPGQQSAAAAVRYLRPILRWAGTRGLASSDLAATQPPAVVQRRDRVLSDAELGRLLPVLSTDAGGYGRLCRFILLTLARREEAAGMRWRDVDLRAGTWTISSDRAKNAREHVVPLPRQARDLLVEIGTGEPGALVFATCGGRAFANHDRATKALSAAAGVHGWTRHDLRRTGATTLGKLGEPPHVIEAALNHAAIGGQLAALYNRARYRAEVAAALQRLADMLDALEAGTSRVVPFRAVAG